MSTSVVTRRRLGRAAALMTAAAAVTGTWGLASAASTPTADDQAAPQPTAPAPVGTLFARTELYFGTDRKAGPDVSEAEFDRFVDRIVTRRFPDGLTQIEADGQFRLANNQIVEEKSYVIILLYPLDDTSAHREIEEIRKLYKESFDQESVLRVDSRERVSF